MQRQTAIYPMNNIEEKKNSRLIIHVRSYAFVFIKRFVCWLLLFLTRQQKQQEKSNENLSFTFKNLALLPVRVRKFTLLRSPHIHKRSREQFEIRGFHVTFQLIINDSADGSNKLITMLDKVVSCYPTVNVKCYQSQQYVVFFPRQKV